MNRNATPRAAECSYFHLFRAAAIGLAMLAGSAGPGVMAAELPSEIAVGTDHTCATTTEGRVRCWGKNDQGQLGNGSVGNSVVTTPTTVVSGANAGPLENVKSISSDGFGTCAVLGDGTVQCWGRIMCLDDPTSPNSSNLYICYYKVKDQPQGVPYVVTTTSGPLLDVKEVSVGNGHRCALLKSGQVRCWGLNKDGQLGNGTKVSSQAPVAVKVATPVPPYYSNLTGVKSISVAANHSCATLNNGQVKCWGNAVGGRLGNGITSESTLAVSVQTLKDLAPVALGGVDRVWAGAFHNCAKMTDGTARCWGSNDFSELGAGATVGVDARYAVRVRGPFGFGWLNNIQNIVPGAGFTCAVQNDGNVMCWGKNNEGQIGNGTTIGRTYPYQVKKVNGQKFSNASSIDAHGNVCTVSLQNSIDCWGNGDLNPTSVTW